MPLFTTEPPPDDRGPALPIMRTPTHKPIVAIITSENLIGCDTHFYHGRSTPHEKNDCPACLDGLPRRWHAYVSAYNARTGLHFIFECTRKATEALVDYRDVYKTLRGCLFEAHRLNPRPNGQVIIRTKPADLSDLRLPAAPNLVACLCILWNIPYPAIDETLADTVRYLKDSEAREKLS